MKLNFTICNSGVKFREVLDPPLAGNREYPLFRNFTRDNFAIYEKKTLLLKKSHPSPCIGSR